MSKLPINEIDPKLLVDQRGMTKVKLPKGHIVYLQGIPMLLWAETEFEIHVGNLTAAGLI